MVRVFIFLALFAVIANAKAPCPFVVETSAFQSFREACRPRPNSELEKISEASFENFKTLVQNIDTQCGSQDAEALRESIVRVASQLASKLIESDPPEVGMAMAASIVDQTLAFIAAKPGEPAAP